MNVKPAINLVCAIQVADHISLGCVWSYLSQELTKKFTGPSGRCNNDARAAIRLGFHDAGTWSSKLAAAGQDFGGADGSIVLSPDEAKRPENKGLLSIINDMKQIQRKWGVGMADLIQFAATHAVVTCPLGPRIRFFVGRSDSVRNAPDNLLPSVTASADALVALFEDKTISSHELAALLGAHSVSRQFFSNTTTGGQPQDSTPGVWDTRFYNETQAGTIKGVYQLPSDIVLAADSRMSTEWAMFRRPGGIGQLHWNSVSHSFYSSHRLRLTKSQDYAKAFTRLSLLGVNNINQLVECSKVLPVAKPIFAGADQVLMTE